MRSLASFFSFILLSGFSAEASTYHLWIVAGEKATRYSIDVGMNGEIRSQSVGQPSVHRLSEKNRSYLKQRIAELQKSQKNLPLEKLSCPRQMMLLTDPNKKPIAGGCIGSSTKNAREMAQFANLVQWAIQIDGPKANRSKTPKNDRSG